MGCTHRELFEPRPRISSNLSMTRPSFEGTGLGVWVCGECRDEDVEEYESEVDRVGNSSKDDCGSGVTEDGGSGGEGNELNTGEKLMKSRVGGLFGGHPFVCFGGVLGG